MVPFDIFLEIICKCIWKWSKIKKCRMIFSYNSRIEFNLKSPLATPDGVFLPQVYMWFSIRFMVYFVLSFLPKQFWITLCDVKLFYDLWCICSKGYACLWKSAFTIWFIKSSVVRQLNLEIHINKSLFCGITTINFF